MKLINPMYTACFTLYIILKRGTFTFVWWIKEKIKNSI